MQSVWEQVLGLIEEKVGKTTTETWLKPIRPLALRDDTLHLEVPSALFRDWLLGNLLKPLNESLAATLGYPAQVSIHVGDKPQGELFPADDAEVEKEVEKADLSRSTRKGGLVSHYTFSTFVVGAGNQFAHAAAHAVADHPGRHYNPLFIYGGVGLGKTHLINAVGHATLAQQGRSSVFYLSSESFTNELIAHLRRDRMDDFKNKFRQADALILDDVQFLSGRERTQEEFFHTFNTLYDAHKQIVLTSDKFPNEIGGLEERLRNRFEWGLIADIQPPDLETRVAILEKKAEMEGIPITDEVALFLGSNIDSNVRELEGSLTRLGAFASLTKTQITVELTKEVLRNTLKGPQHEITVEGIQKTICDFYNVKLGDLKAKRRTKNIAIPRQVAMYLCRKYTETSFPAIGDKFGGRDHSTVIHASKTVERKLKEDPYMQTTIEKLERNLNVKK